MRAASSSDAEGRQERPSPSHAFLISETPLGDRMLDDLSWLYVGFGERMDASATRRMRAPWRTGAPQRWPDSMGGRYFTASRRRP
jgi:hypothetical protein